MYEAFWNINYNIEYKSGKGGFLYSNRKSNRRKICKLWSVELYGRMPFRCQVPILRSMLCCPFTHKYSDFQKASRISLCELSIPIESIVETNPAVVLVWVMNKQDLWNIQVKGKLFWQVHTNFLTSQARDVWLLKRLVKKNSLKIFCSPLLSLLKVNK